MNRLVFIVSCLVATSLQAAKPNFLVIVTDDQRPDTIAALGNPRISTPNLDWLVKNGLTFENFICSNPLCVPSRMSLLSGRYPSQQDVWMNDDFLASDIPTFAHSLGAAGYEPTIIGRMHAIGPDQLHGYVHREVGRPQSQLDWHWPFNKKGNLWYAQHLGSQLIKYLQDQIGNK